MKARHGFRGVSGIVAAIILLLMFVGTIIIYETFIAAQQRIFQAQREAAKLQSLMRSLSNAIILYYNLTPASNGVSLIIVAENKAGVPATLSDLIVEWGYDNIPFNITIIGNNTQPGAPNFQSLAQLLYQLAGVEPTLNMTLVYAEGGETHVSSLPVTLGPGDKLIVNITPLPLDFKIYTIEALLQNALPGGAVVSTLVTPKVLSTTVTVYAATVPPTTAGTGTGVSPPPFDTVTWVYGIPLKINCTYSRVDWPTAVIVNFTALGINYEVNPLGVRLFDLDNNAWVPVNVTQIAPNYMVIVFPLTCQAGQLRNFTIYAAGGPLAHPEGFYPVGLAKLWNGTIAWQQGITYYKESNGAIDYIVLSAPIGTIEPLDETTLANYETDISSNVDNSQSLTTSIPYYGTSISSLYVHSDVRLNTTSSDLYASPSISGLAQGYPALAPAWLAGWKYYIEIQVQNPLGYTLYNVLVNISTAAFDTQVRDHLFAHARSDGGDIIFVDLSTGRPLQFLTIKWDPTNQEAEWLVKIPELDPWQTIKIGLFYGNPAYNGSLVTFVSNPDNLNYVYEFLSNIQPPSSAYHGYQWNYTYFALPVNTYEQILAATNYTTPNATVDSRNNLYTTLPSYTFPFYGVTYDLSTWEYVYTNYAQYSQNSWISTNVAWIYNSGSANYIEINLYYNTSYADAIGQGLVVRASGTLYYVRTFFGIPISTTVIGYFNNSIIYYSNGVVRYVYGPIYVESGYTPPSVQVDVANGTSSGAVIAYSGYITDLSDHNDIVFVPYAPLATVYWWHPAESIYYASLSASSVTLPRYAGGGFDVFHWKSSGGIYGSNLDVELWLAWDGDILLVPYSLPRSVDTITGTYVINYTIGFAPGIAGDPGIVLFSDADNVAYIYNFTRDATLVTPDREVLLLRYNGSYTVYLGQAVPMFPWVVGWLHGLRVVIHNPLNVPLVNYTVHITLGADNLTSDYLSSALFGKDIRVLDAQGDRIPFWVYYYDANVPIIEMWVKVPSIPAGGNATIYIYYDAQPPPGVTVKDDSNPYATMLAYMKVSAGECPPWKVYNTTDYECLTVVQPGYPTETLVEINMTPGSLVRFYNDTVFGVSGVYGYEYVFNITPDSAAVDYDVVVELVPYGKEEQPPTTAGSYGVVFGGGVLGRLVAGTLNTTWEQGSVNYSIGAEYTVVIRINGTSMVTLVYNSTGGLVASAVDSVDANGYYEAAVTSYSSSLSGTVRYTPLVAYVRPWVYEEPYVVSSVLLM